MNECYIGIDLGGTRIKMGLVHENRVIARSIIDAESGHGLAARLPQIKTEMEDLLRKAGVEITALKGVGLAFPGLVDVYSSKVLSTNEKYDDAPALDIADWINQQWGVPFFMDNDARMAAAGEWKYGAATDTDDLVMMTIGTGIGSSVVMQGKLMRGKHFQAGCLGGHISIQYNGKKCTCGNNGCLEAYGSTWGLPEMVKAAPGFSDSLLSHVPRIDFAALFSAAGENDQLALRIRDQYLDIWATGVVNLIHAYDPEVVVLGGGVLESRDIILPYIREKVGKLAWTPWGKVDIRATELLSDAGILGVVHCLRYKL